MRQKKGDRKQEKDHREEIDGTGEEEQEKRRNRGTAKGKQD